MQLARRVQLKASTARPSAKPVVSLPRRAGPVAQPRLVAAKAAEEDPSVALQKKSEEALAWVKEQWERTSDAEKPAAIAIIIGVVVAQIAIGATVDAVNKIPFISTFLEFVGLAVTGAYAYRYFTDPAERDSVKSNIDSFMDSVSGKK